MEVMKAQQKIKGNQMEFVRNAIGTLTDCEDAKCKDCVAQCTNPDYYELNDLEWCLGRCGFEQDVLNIETVIPQQGNVDYMNLMSFNGYNPSAWSYYMKHRPQN